jgi:hypothetical protein
MENEMMVYEAERAVARVSGNGYKVKAPFGTEVKLERDVDFGVIPGTKSPSLYKSGAEKVCMAYGLLQHFTTESKIEQYDKSGCFFYFLVKCELVKIANDGKEYIFTTGYGSANTAERRNGKNANTPEAINACIKMAEKRSLVAAALHISGLSDMFTQDIEDEAFMRKANDTILKEDDPLTKAQLVRLFAIAGKKGLRKPQVQKIIAEAGFNSATEIKQKDYVKVCGLFEDKE